MRRTFYSDLTATSRESFRAAVDREKISPWTPDVTVLRRLSVLGSGETSTSGPIHFLRLRRRGAEGQAASRIAGCAAEPES